MSVAHDRAMPPGPCRNCGAALPSPARYCGQCGQETALHPPTLSEFVHEFVGHYVALEGALWRTLKLLLFKPGQLTREYLEGRRRRYVLPLRIYLTASFLFFLIVKLLPSAVDQAAVDSATRLPAQQAAQAIRESAASAPAEAGVPALVLLHDTGCGAASAPACNAFERSLYRIGERFRSDPRRFVERMSSRFSASVPYAVFLMLPAFAGIVALVYRRRGRTYGEHFVFSLHLHAFWFLALLAMMLLPVSGSDLVALAVPVHGVLALRTVYGGRWGATLGRAALVSVLYGLLLLLVTLGLVATLLTFA